MKSTILVFAGLSLGVLGCAHPEDVKHAEAPRETAAPTPPPPPPAVEKSGDEGGKSGLGTSIYFDYDAADLTSQSTSLLEQYAQDLKQNPSKQLRIEGNCDERGTAEYNLALGQHRADAARKYLTRLGVSKSRIKTVSYGSERPKAQGHDESAWQENRRDDMVVR